MARRKLGRRVLGIAFLASLLLVSNQVAIAQSEMSACNMDLRNPFGPFDYRTASEDKREIVETNHFTEQVEGLIRGQTGPIGGDIAYTLRAFPNHPRALMAMARLAQREEKPTPKGSRYSVDCWFARALAFQPDDPQVHLVFGVALLLDGKSTPAIEQLHIAEASLPDNPNVAYNLGLAYFETKDFDKSLKYAHQAYSLGFPLPGLRDKLKRAGRWKD